MPNTLTDGTQIPSTISCGIDLSAPGKHMGYLHLPHSVHRSAYGVIPIPVASISNGSGPTVLLMSGNHGDEYEGQVLLTGLIRDLMPEQVKGRIIILPMANFPAAQAGTRTSPIDQGNLNRTFPGRPRGTPTEVIAHYIETVLMNEADYFFDFHSGGSSLLYVPTLLTSLTQMPGREDEVHAVIKAFGMPQTFIFGDDKTAGVSSAAAQRQGVLTFSTELGGAGMIDREIVGAAKVGLMRALHTIGVLTSDGDAPAPEPTHIYPKANIVFASEDGLFEPLYEIGADVPAGELVALIHHPETPGKEPTEVRTDQGGFILAKRVPARSIRGDCLYHIGCEE